MLRKLALAVGMLAASALAAAAEYPERPITLIVPYAPGGTTDVFGRAVADVLSRELGQPVIVENRPGAGGAVGSEQLAAAAPDGYTIGFLSSATFLGINFQGKDFRVGKSLDAIAEYQSSTMLIAVNKSRVPVKTLAELVEWLKKNPGTTYSSSGVGSVNHLSTEAFTKANGISVEHVGYRGAGPAMQALVAGEIEFGSGADRMSAREHIRAGTIVGLATTGKERSPLFPDLQTVHEAGFPELEARAFGGLFAPHGTPTEIIERLAAAVEVATRDPAFLERMKVTGTDVYFTGPAELTESMNAEIDRYKKIVTDLGITIGN
jgi:tripartite-type tricarboxylate transporter receptor subunit TctC